MLISRLYTGIFDEVLNHRIRLCNRKIAYYKREVDRCVSGNKRRYFSTALEPPFFILNNARINALTSKLSETLQVLLRDSNIRRSFNGNDVISIGLLTPLNNTSAIIFASLLLQPKVSVSLLPSKAAFGNIDIKDLTNLPSKSHPFHVLNAWRNLMVESSINLLITSTEDVNLVSGICKDLIIPFGVIVNEPNILMESEYKEAISAGHGYIEFLNSCRLDFKTLNENTTFTLNKNFDSPLNSLHVFTEVFTANSKAVVQPLLNIALEIKKLSSIVEFAKNDLILNTIPTHEYSSFVHGLLAPLSNGASVLFTRVDEMRAVSNFLKLSKEKASMLLCNYESFQTILDYVLKDRNLKLNNIIVVVNVLQMNKLELSYEAENVTELVVLPETGIIASRTSTQTDYTYCTGVEIFEDSEVISVRVKGSGLFDCYYGKEVSTRSVLNGDSFSKTFEKRREVTKLLDAHKDYVLYFKKKRDRMKKYPQGYIKKVPVKTQFWGSFTGKHKHHSVL